MYIQLGQIRQKKNFDKRILKLQNVKKYNLLLKYCSEKFETKKKLRLYYDETVPQIKN